MVIRKAMLTVQLMQIYIRLYLVTKVQVCHVLDSRLQRPLLQCCIHYGLLLSHYIRGYHEAGVYNRCQLSTMSV